MKRVLPFPLFAAAVLAVFAGNAAAADDEGTMLAVVGSSLELKQVPIPAPGNGEVLVRVRAASANPVDWRVGGAPGGPPAGGGAPGAGSGGPPAGAPGGMRGGPMMQMNANNVPGFDAAGVIVKLGDDVTGWKVGDEVVAFLDARGAYAQYAVAPAAAIAAKSTKLTFEQAAGIPTVAYAAWAVLVDVAQVGEGDRVLVHGGAGGVGSTAVQIAKAKGAYVIATASPGNHDYLRSIGAGEVIDYNTVRFEDVVKDLDIVVNTVRVDDTANRSIQTLRKGGKLVSVAEQADASRCAEAGITCSGRRMDGATPVGEVLKAMNAMADAGKYTVNIDGVYPLEKIQDAFAKGREGHTRGKLIISIP